MIFKKLFVVVMVVTSSAILSVFSSPSKAIAQTFFSCTDDRGHQITSDRPIAQCTDRNQKELSPTGIVQRVRGPTLTTLERRALDEKEKSEADARARLTDEKQRNRALLARYPDRAALENERNLILSRLEKQSIPLRKKILELSEQRKSLVSAFDSHTKDKSKVLPAHKQKLEAIDASLTMQNYFLDEQEIEKNRSNARFDLALPKLSELWLQTDGRLGLQDEKK